MNESLIIYKHNKKIKNPRFYMYSEDQESLILVAEKQQDHDHEWIISQDSINLNRTNKFLNLNFLLEFFKKHRKIKAKV